MKLLSVAIPCYNSAAYMESCIDSLLPGGEDVEILIIDDGSKDDTSKIADRLQADYPGIVKAIHQENGGHGAAVNTGLKNATGLYFKVVDSDDHVDLKAYKAIIKKLKEMALQNQYVDMFIANYEYDKVGAKKIKVIEYRKTLPEGRIFTWDETKHFKRGEYILMHSVIYKTALLKKCNLNLPRHTFYVDNIYVFRPMPEVKTMYYMDVNFYKYYIGREDQSVNEKIMIKRVDQQIKVNRIMFDYYSQIRDELAESNKKLSRYMYKYLEIMCAVSSILLILDGSREALAKKKALWKWMRSENFKLYIHLRHGFVGVALNLPGTFGRDVAKTGYRIAQKIFKFN